MKNPLEFIQKNQANLSLALILAAGLIGAYSQEALPVRPGAEMWLLAKNIAAHGTFANPFGTMATGPTAANPPLYPYLLALFIKLFRTPLFIYGASVLGSILMNAVTVALLPRISGVLYGDPTPGIFASVLWLAAMQTIPGWDTNYTVAGLLFFCVFTASSAGTDRNAGWSAAIGGVTAGLLFLLNPSSLLITLPWIGFLLWQSKDDLRRSIKHCGIVAAVLCMFLVGWGVRNDYELGAFVVRTNLGMTLYASNNDCARPSLIADEENGCYQAHHPSLSLAEVEYLSKIGEVQYDRNRIADTKAWIHANPARFLQLTMARTVEFWFPATVSLPPGIELANNFSIPNYERNWERQQNRIAYAIWIITVLSIPGFVLMARRREPVVLYILAVVAIYPLMYYVVVSDMRYRYPVLWLSLLPAGYLIRELLNGSAFQGSYSETNASRVRDTPQADTTPR